VSGSAGRKSLSPKECSNARGDRQPAVLRSNNADILRAAALSGIGIALLPSWAVGDDLRSGALTRILPGCEPPPSAVYAVYPSNRLMSAKVRAFVDHLARRIGRMPYWDKGL
jgi:DNA-binding transcriptional LysR family regulator